MATSSTSTSLQTRLTQALPSNVELHLHHIVSDPFACPEVFAAPPDELPESTTSESHFLSASIQHDGKPLQVFALEIYVYTTAALTTIFVSKADSTGYLHLLKLPTGTRSPIKTTITTFLDWLIEQKRRRDARLVVSLFARAQNQYLFPGSVENNGKHVLSDRELIRWWCRVLDPILLEHADSDVQSDYKAHGHLIVPGLDAYETRPYFPKVPSAAAGKPRWTANDPLQAIGKPANLPVRCYIPRFPDDPKARFVIDLDDELPDEPDGESNQKGRSPGIWKSVKSLSQFWELMAFRQECSAGRVVGFLWAVIEPNGLVDKPHQAILEIDPQGEPEDEIEEPTLPTPLASQHQDMGTNQATEFTGALESLEEDLPTPVPSSQPQPTEHLDTKPAELDVIDVPAKGQRTESGIKLNDEAYKKSILLLESLDYSTLELALDSTAKFLQAVDSETKLGADWALNVKGEKVTTTASNGDVQPGKTAADNASISTPAVNVLSTGMIRSKKRSIEDTAPKEPEVRVLSASSVRKKPKA